MELSTSETTSGLTTIILVSAFCLSIWALIMLSSDFIGSYIDERESRQQETQRLKNRGKVTPRELDPHHVHGYQVRL